LIIYQKLNKKNLDYHGIIFANVAREMRFSAESSVCERHINIRGGKMKRHFIQSMAAALFIISGVLSTSAALAVSWTDWQYYPYTNEPTTQKDDATVSGVISTVSGSINVTLTGLISGIYQNTYWWAPQTTFTELTAPSDMITEHFRGTVNLTFDKPVEDLYIALFSVGNSAGYPITYTFNTAIEVISSGPSANYAGSGFAEVGTNYIIGAESNGILKLAGTFNQLTIGISGAADEWYHGFNIGVDSIADNPGPVPEPTTMLLFGTGIAGLVAARRKKKS
jgi:hypothetical protein